MNQLTHFNDTGHARMVDISEKDITTRIAIASGEIHMQQHTLQCIQRGQLKKGDVLAVADIAAIMAAKKTPDIIPMCHPLMLSGVDVSFSELPSSYGLKVTVTVKCKGETGVEMEALTAVSAALLTIYDMCKAVDKDMHLEHIGVEEKKGGKSGDYLRQKHAK